MDFKKRISNLRAEMQNKKLDAVFVSSIPNIIYLTGLSIFLAEEREAYLLITKNNLFVITDGRYKSAVLKENFELIELSPKSPLNETLGNTIKKFKIKRIGIEEYDLKVSEYKLISKHVKKFLNFDLKNQRQIKDEYEIVSIKKACKLADMTFGFILNKIKQGVTEKEIAFEIEYFIKKKNADISFSPIVAFGENSAIPHHKPTGRKLKTGDFVLMDFGTKVNNYCSDITRTVFFGKASKEQKKIYQIVLESQKKAIDYLNNVTMKQLNNKKNRIDASTIDTTARNYITSQGYPTIPHSLGHGVGLEIHESPRLSPSSKDILKPGMVFSVEPGIYLPAGRQGIPDFGGVRIEDLVCIKEKEIDILTKSTKELIEI